MGRTDGRTDRRTGRNAAPREIRIIILQWTIHWIVKVLNVVRKKKYLGVVVSNDFKASTSLHSGMGSLQAAVGTEAIGNAVATLQACSRAIRAACLGDHLAVHLPVVRVLMCSGIGNSRLL